MYFLLVTETNHGLSQANILAEVVWKTLFVILEGWLETTQRNAGLCPHLQGGVIYLM